MASVPLDSPPVLLLAGIIGYLLRNSINGNIKNILGNINILFFMPLVMGVTFAKRGFQVHDIWILGLVLFYVTMITPIVAFASRMYDSKRRASIIITSIFPNSVNLPLPILLAIRGDYSYAAVYAILINLVHIVYVASLATILLSRKSSIGGTVIFLTKGMTPLYGALIGYYVYLNFNLPAYMWSILEFLRSLGIFMFVFVAGLLMPTLGFSKMPLSEFKIVTLIRFIISPLLVVFYSIATGILGYSAGQEAFAQVLVESIMPPAVINVSYSVAFGFDTEYVALAVVILTLPGAMLGASLAFLL